MVRHNPRAEMPEEAKVVSPQDAAEHGYWGQVPDLNDNESYTRAGMYLAESGDKHEVPAGKPASRRAAKKDGE